MWTLCKTCQYSFVLDKQWWSKQEAPTSVSRSSSLLGIVYLIFVAIVLFIYHTMTYDPHDEVAVPFIWSDTEIPEQYGKITIISRDEADGIIESENSVLIPYRIETEKFALSITVTLIKDNNKWIAEKIEITEVNELGN